MARTYSVGSLKGARELAALLDILSCTFNFPREHGERYSQIVGKENYRVIRRGREIVGGCALLPMGQFFGGKSVLMRGVAAVAIAPERRGDGAATSLMQAVLREMRATRWPISTLYPATLPLYRAVGYEQAGHRCEIRIPAKSLIIRERDKSVLVRRIGTREKKAVEDLYRTWAAHAAGHLDRSLFIWSRLRNPRGASTEGFLAVNEAGKPEGYLYCMRRESAEAPYSIHLTDFLAVSPAAGRRLLSFLADHRSMTDQVTFMGGTDDPILKLLPERNYGIKLLDHWMTRIVDVGAALKARGYPACADAELHLNVSDDLLMENNGRYVLTVRGGKPQAASGGRGDLKIDIRGLAALYTGHASPDHLVLTGHLAPPRSKSERDAFATASALFAGPTPWMREMF